MTKEELKKEAEEYANHNDWFEFSANVNKIGNAIKTKMERAYLAGAEPREKRIADLEKENAELRKVAEFQQSSNMSRHFENKKLKEGLAVGSTFNKALNSMNKNLEEGRDKYRNMVFDKDEQLTNAKEIIKDLINLTEPTSTEEVQHWNETFRKAEQFLKECK